MSVDYKVRQIYNDIIHEVTKNAENWKDVLSLTGRIYRYEFDNILMIYSVSALCFVVECYDKNAPLAFRVEHAERRIKVV